MKKILFLSLGLVLLLTTCCKDKMEHQLGPYGSVAGYSLDELGLPAATCEGLNTMGCLINGEPWLPIKKNFLDDWVYHIPFSLTGNGSLNINGQYDNEEENMRQTLRFSGGGVDSVGVHLFLEMNGQYFTDYRSCGGYNVDSTYASNGFQITCLDQEAEILSGTFAMRVYNQECDTLTITNGRFDVGGN